MAPPEKPQKAAVDTGVDAKKMPLQEQLKLLRERIEKSQKLPPVEKAKLQKKVEELEAKQTAIDQQAIDTLEQEIAKTDQPDGLNVGAPAMESPMGTWDKAMKMFEDFTSKFEFWKNQAAYALAPMILQLKQFKIPGFNFGFEGTITFLEQFFSFDALMISSALRKASLQPAFNMLKPETDKNAISKLAAYADAAIKKNPTLEKQEFYNQVVTTFAEQLENRTVMSLSELEPIAKDIAEGVKPQKPTEPDKKDQPNTPPVVPPVVEAPPAAPQTPTEEPVRVEKTAEGTLTIKQGDRTITVKAKQDGSLLIDNGVWNLRLVSTSAGLPEKAFEGQNLSVSAIDAVDGKVSLTIAGQNISIDPEILKKLMASIIEKRDYAYEKTDDETKVHRQIIFKKQ